MMVQSLVERLRPLVGAKRWDYIVLWKLRDDQRCIEWKGCCCAGAENTGSDLLLPVSCRDAVFPHPRTGSCELLDQLPSSMLLDSGYRVKALLSRHQSWSNFTNNSDSSFSEDAIGTRVLVPLSLGLLEVFVAKQVPEDQQVIDFIRDQSNSFSKQQELCGSVTDQPISSSHLNAQKVSTTIRPQISKKSPSLPQDCSIEGIYICDSPMNPLHSETNDLNKYIYLEGETCDAYAFSQSVENGLMDLETTQSNIISSSSGRWMEPPFGAMDDGTNSSFVHENDHLDISDPNEDADDAKYRRRTGKGPKSKNLMAERKRRKKLNDRLYSLRALVPNISKLDRASILGDAIEYVKELKKQVDDLQFELEEHSDEDEGEADTVIPMNTTRCRHENFQNGFHTNERTDEKMQEIEPQVEVFQLHGNEFFIKVLSEQRSGGFMRMMEALGSLGVEVTSVNTTRHTCLVSSNFKVERKNNDTVLADHMRESLLELTRNPWMQHTRSDGW